MFTIMLVEDEQKIRGFIIEALNNWGYHTHQVTDFQLVEKDFLAVEPDLVILDINLPYYNGFYWCERLRKHSNVPIIFLSSRTEEMDMMMALNIGGDDFIQKPFSMELLLTKIHSLLRRTYTYHAVQMDVVVHRDLTLNIKTATVSVGEIDLELTRNEFKILSILLAHKQEIISREDLMRALWEDESFIDDNTLTVNVNRLRRKLRTCGLQDYIETKKGQGYILT